MIENIIDVSGDAAQLSIDWLTPLFITVFVICGMRLILNFVMRKKGILPPLSVRYLKFNIIMLAVLALAIILDFVLSAVISNVLTLMQYVLPIYQSILLVGIVWILAYMTARKIFENLKSRKASLR